jgi:hypothetical protein
MEREKFKEYEELALVSYNVIEMKKCRPSDRYT